MAGYNHVAGMSHNACEAYDDGRIPISRLSRYKLDKVGFNYPVEFAKFLVRKGFWSTNEFHHTGGSWYNSTNFYNPNDLLEFFELEKEEQEALLSEFEKEKKEGKEKKEEGQKVKGSFAIWGGSRKNPRKEGEQEFTGMLRNGWIFLDGGGKKKADGNWIKYSKV